MALGKKTAYELKAIFFRLETIMSDTSIPTEEAIEFFSEVEAEAEAKRLALEEDIKRGSKD